MTETDIASRFTSLRGALTPTESAHAAIDLAVTRRRRRPLVVGGALAGVAGALVIAVAVLPGSTMVADDAATSFTNSAPESGFADLAPVEMTGERVGDWTGAADVVVVISSHPTGDSADITEVSWRRTHQSDSPAGRFAVDSLEVDEAGTFALPTAGGTPSTTTLGKGREYLAALRWEQVRCDGLEPGWVLLGDDAVLPFSNGVVGADHDGSASATTQPGAARPGLDDLAAQSFAGMSSADVAQTLDELIADHDVTRSRGLCQ